jgi:copper chaperone NosL
MIFSEVASMLASLVSSALAPARAPVLALTLSLAVVGCGPSTDGTPSDAFAAVEIADHECAVCGMLVRDQPAPRAQLVHRDGTRAFTCSLGDLMVQLGAPSPHGRPTEVWVEVLATDADPDERATHAHRWLPADEAWYVVGLERRGIMGPPVLAYAEKAHAEARASQHEGTHVFDRGGLEAWWKAMHR